jgi:DNA-binding NtrC family response regulator
MPKARIFQVAYDASLMRVRAEMLKHAGFEVWSALGNDEARCALEAEANYDLVVVAWSASDSSRGEMVRWLKQRWPAVRVIALHSHLGHPIAEADVNSCSEKPEEWFAAVKRSALA